LVDISIICTTYTDAWLDKGVIIYNKGRKRDDIYEYEKALDCFNKAIRCFTENKTKNISSAWYTKGLVLNSLKRHEEAIYCFEEATNYSDGEYKLADTDKVRNRKRKVGGLAMACLEGYLAYC
jgi:tetratricopeptide (TPR) repeat protein